MIVLFFHFHRQREEQAMAEIRNQMRKQSRDKPTGNKPNSENKNPHNQKTNQKKAANDENVQDYKNTRKDGKEAREKNK